MARTVSRAVILPYKMGSRSAKMLALEVGKQLGLKVRRVRPNGKYRPKHRSLILNYGSSSGPLWEQRGTWVNQPRACAASGNKLSAFQVFRQCGLAIPDFTTERRVADGWLGEGSTVVCRTTLTGHSGRGIVLADTLERMVNAPLYTRYKKKRKEFRVHVFKDKVIDVAEKRRVKAERRDDKYDGYIRNHANGWVFCRNDVVRPADLDGLALAACRALGLDFGAVDIIWNERENKCYLLEVNTAPGLTGTTLANYTNAIVNWIRAQ
jgi:glutathione synthase/RimK-type ligase-like ATP-grasp enzyme